MIRQANAKDLPALAELACRLWPDHSMEEMEAELARIMAKPEAAFFLAFHQERAVGFAQCQLRHDYVEGTDSSPVGYLEGIFVAEDRRHQGIAKALLAACEGWARDQGCAEFASDCELSNVDSLRFHLKVGFLEAGRVICFTKKL
jgi:aminoglycoside 6'-N-acetyltransferase I